MPLLESFSALDRLVLDRFAGEDSVATLAAVESRLDRCEPLDAAIERETCFVEAVLQGGGLSPVAADSTAEESSLTHLLESRRGSCAAMVATVLALTEARGRPFDAVVFDHHVMLASRARANHYYEVLQGGAPRSEIDLIGLRAHSHDEIRVGGLSFAAYYVDNLAARLASDGNPQAADTAFKKALSLRPSDGRILYNYGTFLLRAERFEEARGLLHEAIEADPLRAAAYVNRGVAYWHLDQPAKARRDFQLALDVDPANEEARANLADLAGSSPLPH